MRITAIPLFYLRRRMIVRLPCTVSTAALKVVYLVPTALLKRLYLPRFIDCQASPQTLDSIPVGLIPFRLPLHDVLVGYESHYFF